MNLRKFNFRTPPLVRGTACAEGRQVGVVTRCNRLPFNPNFSEFLIVKFSDESGHIQLNHSNEGRLNEIRFILQNTTPQDTVLDGWIGSGVFRDHVYYYYFLHGEVRNMLTPKESSEDVVNALREKKTKIVIYDGDVQALSQEVRNYIEANYKPTGLGSLYIRNDQ